MNKIFIAKANHKNRFIFQTKIFCKGLSKLEKPSGQRTLMYVRVKILSRWKVHREVHPHFHSLNDRNLYTSEHSVITEFVSAMSHKLALHLLRSLWNYHPLIKPGAKPIDPIQENLQNVTNHQRLEKITTCLGIARVRANDPAASPARARR